MGLQEYHRKRDFDATAEPRGREHPERAGDALSFVVQKHAASHLHYDFRLELDGVLKSWAVPKGPSLDPAVKRLAVHVEDHPLEYGTFEGIIPRGEYGGGTVMLWDRGSWEPTFDPHKGYRKGHLRFRLHGERLRGEWHLVRSRRGGDDGQKEQWLLFKGDDEEARPATQGEITEAETTSVDTGRTMDEIAADRDATWRSNREEKKQPARKQAAPPARPAAAESTGPSPAELPGARKASMPKVMLPELATLVDDVPAGGDWVHEIKYDGYRLVVSIDGGRVRMVTRKANDWTGQFPALAPRFARLPARQAIVDGELVVMHPNGTTSFQLLQNAIHAERQDELVFFVFDLMYLDGYDLRGVPLLARKERLRALMAGLPAEGPIRFSDHVVGNGRVFHDQACRWGLEGIIAKRADSRYAANKRTKDWLKVKCMRRQEFVLGGYTDPKGSRTGFGALLLGVYEGGDLVYVGKVGTGFDDETLRGMHTRMRKLETDESPFANLRRRPRDVHWIRPELVGEVAFTEWTGENILRHPAFQGLREDKSPREVVREEPVPPPPPSRKKTDDSKTSSASLPSPAPRRRSRGKGGPEAEVAGVRITHPEKVLFSGIGMTKLELARYYEAVAPWLLPYGGRRPLTLVRCPEGAGNPPCFFQKHAEENFPKAVGRVKLVENDGSGDLYMYVDSAAGLVGMAQMYALELHVWGSRIDNLERPDLFVLDLDPATDLPWERVVESAFAVREQLEEIGLRSFLKTTGGKGLHLVVPLARRNGWDEVKEFTHRFVIAMSGRFPGRYVTKSTLAKRKGKIFLDYLRNARGATAISAYALRAKPHAPVSVPLRWDELSPRLTSDVFTPPAVLRRLRALKADPWEGFADVRQSITKKMKEAVGMK
ncbi:MAG TPA: DNA ligase D [Longimicrobiaceae bacterium]|nr:DNA ligase D [Longimicrobiaceae bacterium]